MKVPLVVSVLVVSAGPAMGASPAVSRGEVKLSVSFEECMARARATFSAEGWKVVEELNTSYVLAHKGIHTAYLTCTPAPDAETWANVFVASWTQDKKVPGAERIKLQGRMSKAAPQVSPKQ